MLKPGIDYTGIAVAFFCHDGKGNFVFHKRSATTRGCHGTWDAGGGHLNFCEDILEGLFRELREEYGCTGKITTILPPISHILDTQGKKSHWVILPYIILVSREDVCMNEPESMTEIGWFTLDTLPEPLHPGVKIELEIYKDFLDKYRV